jgi:hypothetical protein
MTFKSSSKCFDFPPLCSTLYEFFVVRKTSGMRGVDYILRLERFPLSNP